jgi:cation transport ATPase
MFGVELYAKIRRAVIVDGMSRREAAKQFGVHRASLQFRKQSKIAAFVVRAKPTTQCRAGLAPGASVGTRPADEALRTAGIEVVMLTGDNERTARAIER